MEFVIAIQAALHVTHTHYNILVIMFENFPLQYEMAPNYPAHNLLISSYICTYPGTNWYYYVYTITEWPELCQAWENYFSSLTKPQLNLVV